MAENKILPWAQTSTANALSDADYAADVATGGSYADGVKSGQASSKQANKTWRQATAPGSGLGQFLVDNLSVDVTDADTPATFSSRIANAILKLSQISPFNQSFAAAIGGYRKYAIVSDSSGNFWVSTADQNVTVPGASGAKWQNLFDGYATNTALSTEASSRSSADTNLQNQINNCVLKTGDTMTGTLFQNLGASAAVIASGLSGPASAGQSPWTPQFVSQATGDGSLKAVFCARDFVGHYPYLSLQLTEQNGTWHELQFRNDDRLYTASGNVFALESDISNLQNQINGKQPAGSYVTTDTYSSDFGTSDSRVINLAYGHKIQGFIVAVEGSGVHDIAFPQAFSGIPTTIVISHGLTNGSNSPVSVLGGWTTTGFQIQTNGSTSVNFLAQGPK